MTRVEFDEIPDVILHKSKAFLDERGSFEKFFEQKNFNSKGLNTRFDSLAISSSVVSGTIRGMHFQNFPFEEEKLITCLTGKIFDVIVDLRAESPTFGKWAGINLESEERIVAFLPKGVAHGFQTLIQNTQVLYGLTAAYDQESAHSLDYADPQLRIKWPLAVTGISQKDLLGISLNEAINLIGSRKQ